MSTTTERITKDEARSMAAELSDLKRKSTVARLSGDDEWLEWLTVRRAKIQAALTAAKAADQEEQSRRFEEERRQREAREAREREQEAERELAAEWLRDRLADSAGQPRAEVLAEAEAAGISELRHAVRELGVSEIGGEYLFGTDSEEAGVTYWTLDSRPGVTKPAAA